MHRRRPTTRTSPSARYLSILGTSAIGRFASWSNDHDGLAGLAFLCVGGLVLLLFSL
jgi:hypothetical protein